MKLLFDQNLSFKLCARLADLFPDSTQVRRAGLETADDREIWNFAKASGFTLVSQDSNFADLAALHGPPPKVIWPRCGNQPTEFVEKLFRGHVEAAALFEADADAACWELF
jgi:predicted nuclease of predicted toxin-antitoxin system